MSQSFDIVIVGAGIVGLSLAMALAPSRQRIALIEAKQPELHWDKTKNDLRVVALTRASQRILQHLTVWDDIVQKRVSPYQKMLVWDELGCGCLQFDSAELYESDLGHIVENNVIQISLWQRLQQFTNVIVIHEKLEHLEVEQDEVIIDLESTQIKSALLVGADGGRSKVRELANIVVSHQSYQQHALVTNVTTSKPHQATARQRFLTTGPLAFLPLSESNSSSIVWSTTTEQAEKLKIMDEELFKQKLAQAFEDCLGEITAIGTRATFPLHRQHVEQYVKSRIALIGDAAHTIHPLAGQGANLGLLDAACLAEVILAVNEKKRDIGQFHYLRRYERWRKSHNTLMIALMGSLKSLFSNDQSLLAWLRNQGLNKINQSSFLKQTLMNYAMGLTGDLPNLAKQSHPNDFVSS